MDDRQGVSVPRPRVGAMDSSQVEIRRSARRKRTVSARREGERVVVLMPAGLPTDVEQKYVDDMLRKIEAGERRRQLNSEDLMGRANGLSRRYLDARARPSSIRWVGNQESRWGSCTPSQATIRLSSRLDGMPDWVVDAVILHELAHLLVSHHGPEFQRLVQRYPQHERAAGFLAGASHAAGLKPLDADDVDEA